MGEDIDKLKTEKDHLKDDVRRREEEKRKMGQSIEKFETEIGIHTAVVNSWHKSSKIPDQNVYRSLNTKQKSFYNLFKLMAEQPSHQFDCQHKTKNNEGKPTISSLYREVVEEGYTTTLCSPRVETGEVRVVGFQIGQITGWGDYCIGVTKNKDIDDVVGGTDDSWGIGVSKEQIGDEWKMLTATKGKLIEWAGLVKQGDILIMEVDRQKGSLTFSRLRDGEVEALKNNWLIPDICEGDLYIATTLFYVGSSLRIAEKEEYLKYLV